MPESATTIWSVCDQVFYGGNQSMTDTAQAAPVRPGQLHHHKPASDAAAVREIRAELHKIHDRALQIKDCPEEHKPKLITSDHVRGSSFLDKIADQVNVICGSMIVFMAITLGIIAWLFLGPAAGFDPVPWALLLTILNLPQLSIMISLQVSANRSQAASDKRAIADHETLIALHSMATQQLDILRQQDSVLAILNNFASKDMPGRQRQIQETVNEILAAVGGPAAAADGPAPA
jgi:uncharacterized membrane protein